MKESGFKMKILVDADASPVKDEVIEVAATFHIAVILVMSIAHYSFDSHPEHVETIYVEKGVDQADFKIVQLAKKGDIIITQDYGLASLLLPKGCRVIHHKGYEYTDYNIERLLDSRHFSALQRKAGLRTKGPSVFTIENRQQFKVFFNHLISEQTNENK